MTPNLYFKVTIFFNIKYLYKSTRSSYEYIEHALTVTTLIR